MGDSGEDYHYVGNLGFWLNRQRQAKKGLGPGGKLLSEERVSQMQTLVDEGTLMLPVVCNQLLLFGINAYIDDLIISTNYFVVLCVFRISGLGGDGAIRKHRTTLSLPS